MTRAVLFDVDGVLVHGYHANPARIRAWDANLLADTGLDPDRFRQEFIFDIFVKKVIIGQMALIDALERRLPALGYKGSPMSFVHYWLANDSVLNQPLLDIVRRLKARSDVKLYIATNQEHTFALTGYGAIWGCASCLRTFSTLPGSARRSRIKSSSTSSTPISARKPSHRCSSTTRPR